MPWHKIYVGTPKIVNVPFLKLARKKPTQKNKKTAGRQLRSCKCTYILYCYDNIFRDILLYSNNRGKKYIVILFVFYIAKIIIIIQNILYNCMYLYSVLNFYHYFSEWKLDAIYKNIFLNFCRCNFISELYSKQNIYI